MLEIVHDLAPGAAPSVFGPSTSVDIANGVNAWPPAGRRRSRTPGVLRGAGSRTASSPTPRGASRRAWRLYLSRPATRPRKRSGPATARSRARTFPDSEYPAVHNYLPGNTDIGNTLTVPPSCSLTVILQWDNRFGAAAVDFDLFIARSSDFVIPRRERGVPDRHAGSARERRSSSARRRRAPWSSSRCRSSTSWAPPASLILDYFAFLDCSGNPGLQYVTPSESLSGNHALVEALPIAAARRGDSGPGRGLQLAGAGHHQLPVSRGARRAGRTSVDCVPTRPACRASSSCPSAARPRRPLMWPASPRSLIERAPTLSTEQLRGRAHGDGGVPRPARLRLHLRVRPRRRLPGARLRVLGAERLSSRSRSTATGRGGRRVEDLPPGGRRGGSATSQDIYFGVPRGARGLERAWRRGSAMGWCSSPTRSPGWSSCANSRRRPSRALAPLFANTAIPAAVGAAVPIANFNVAWPANVPGRDLHVRRVRNTPGARSPTAASARPTSPP